MNGSGDGPGPADAPARPPIRWWFLVAQVPAGGAPVEVRQQWVGLPLPVRRPRPVEAPVPFVGRDVADPAVRRLIDDGVPVATADAIEVLHRFGRTEAAAWWQAYVDGHPTLDGLVFRTGEGRFLPMAEAALRFPEVDGFTPP